MPGGCTKTSQVSFRSFRRVTTDMCSLGLSWWNTTRLLLTNSRRFWSVANFKVSSYWPIQIRIECLTIWKQLIINNSFTVPSNAGRLSLFGHCFSCFTALWLRRFWYNAVVCYSFLIPSHHPFKKWVDFVQLNRDYEDKNLI